MRFFPVLILLVLVDATAAAQSAPAPRRTYAPVCANGVKVLDDLRLVPAPHDTITIPRADKPVVVNSPEEAEAAELDVRRRAGLAGATAIVVIRTEQDDGEGGVRMSRRVMAVYSRADSASAQKACAGG